MNVVQTLQLASGALWLIPAMLLTGRILRSWRAGASRATVLAAPIGFVAWMQVGFTVRWALWPHALGTMNGLELAAWGALYLLSGGLALWVAQGAIKTRGE